MVVMNDLPRHHRACVGETFDFIQALHEKYVDQVEFDSQHRLQKDASISTEITFVGFDVVTNVQKQLKKLASIDLSGCKIVQAGNIDQIRGSLDRVTVLNLADNSLTWNELIHILHCLPNLKEIILSANNLEADADVSYPERPFQYLKSIVLGKVNLNWTTVVEKLLRIWTRIDLIDLWDSQLENGSMTLSGALQSHPFVRHVKSLALSQNRFTDLTWVIHMGQLDNLEDLDLSRCKLDKLGINNQVVEHLKNLKFLNISHNDISSWQEVAQLHFLVNLASLICNENPFYITDKYARSQTIARVGSLTSLNRETVTNSTRRDAEILYLKQYFSEYSAFINNNNNNKDFTLEHPRYKELVNIYGVLGDIGPKKNPVDDKYVTVELCYEGAKISKKVPRDMRVSNLKMLCKAMFKLRSPKGIEIICSECKSPQESLCYPLDQDGQTLHFFSVENNHQLIVKLSD